METKLNLCEILKGYEGERFYIKDWGYCMLLSVNDKEYDNLPIRIMADWVLGPNEYDQNEYCLKSNGATEYNDICILFPNAAQTDWAKWDELHNKCVNADKIKKSADALIEICNLIDTKFGGCIKDKEISYHSAGITPHFEIVIEEEFDEDFKLLYPLIFKSTQEAKEFLSYPENKQLIKNFYNL